MWNLSNITFLEPGFAKFFRTNPNTLRAWVTLSLTTARAVSVESLRGPTFFQHRARLQKAFWLPIPKKVYDKIIMLYTTCPQFVLTPAKNGDIVFSTRKT
jgi:hypothetical protein